MSLLYLTADMVGAGTGGGLVTHQERLALSSLGPVTTVSRKELAPHDHGAFQEPWKWDRLAGPLLPKGVRLCHGYAGTFPGSVGRLKAEGAKVVWTVAAHDRQESRKEHEAFGVDFARLYPHLCEPTLWERYAEGYAASDVIVCPGLAAARAVRGYGGVFASKRIEIIPHGCALPNQVRPLPNTFTVGYMGSFGLDKGVIYLLRAWKKLAYRDAILLLAGRDSATPETYRTLREHGGGNVILQGWVKDVGTFYDQLSLYVQPSVTEGFGIEVVEAMAHGRPVLCSSGAGAADAVPEFCRFPPRDVDALAGRIDAFRTGGVFKDLGRQAGEESKNHTWDKVRERYVALWKEFL